MKRLRITIAAVAAVLAACATQQQVLQSKQQMAIEAASRRGQFEMNCPNVTATVLSDEMTQPALQGPVIEGVPRALYTIGVAGCNQRKTFAVICPEGGTGCFAADPRAPQ
jgi:hypothetical protein